MYETTKKEKALLVLVEITTEKETWQRSEREAEFRSLVTSTGTAIADVIVLRRASPTPAFYIGKGQAERIAESVEEAKVNVVIFNNNLNYTQQRNLEDALGVKAIDRTQLILDIFAAHARTQEGKLQVELAQLQYLLPRLRGKGIILSRQAGGIGTVGPGEKKLEVDRRRINDRITHLKKDLEKVRNYRSLQRKKRIKENIPLCSLIGYTNAGKTTLLKALVDVEARTADSLFTTLDTLVKELMLPNNYKVLVSDTVGFLYKLPHTLIESFKATLEETQYADIILHVVDASASNRERLIDAVNSVLAEIGVKEKNHLLVFNKMDCLDESQLQLLTTKFPEAIFISALHRDNVGRLLLRIEECVCQDVVEVEVIFPNEDFKVMNFLHEHSEVLKIEYQGDETVVQTRIKSQFLYKLQKSTVRVEIKNA